MFGQPYRRMGGGRQARAIAPRHPRPKFQLIPPGRKSAEIFMNLVACMANPASSAVKSASRMTNPFLWGRSWLRG